MLPIFEMPQASDLYNLPCSLLVRIVGEFVNHGRPFSSRMLDEECQAGNKLHQA